MSLLTPDDARSLLALTVAIASSIFWVTGLMQGMVGDVDQGTMARAASTVTAFASATMLGQIAYAISSARCWL
jgi:hypothetical protein